MRTDVDLESQQPGLQLHHAVYFSELVLLKVDVFEVTPVALAPAWVLVQEVGTEVNYAQEWGVHLS